MLFLFYVLALCFLCLQFRDLAPRSAAMHCCMIVGIIDAASPSIDKASPIVALHLSCYLRRKHDDMTAVNAHKFFSLVHCRKAV